MGHVYPSGGPLNGFLAIAERHHLKVGGGDLNRCAKWGRVGSTYGIEVIGEAESDGAVARRHGRSCHVDVCEDFGIDGPADPGWADEEYVLLRAPRPVLNRDSEGNHLYRSG